MQEKRNLQDESTFANTIEFEKLWLAVQKGDHEAQAHVVEQVMPKMLACVTRRFGSCQAFAPEDAVASALRTIQRREWLVMRGDGEEREVVDPQDWGDLTGLLVTFAMNKARTYRKKKRPERLPELSRHEDSSNGQWQAEDGSESPADLIIRREMREDLHEVVERLLGDFDDMHRTILRCKLDGATTKEICDELRSQGIHRVEASVRVAWRKKILPELQRLMQPHADM